MPAACSDNAADTWRNDITGSGTLLLEGTGTLGLAGDNSYAGGTTIDGGVLSAQSATALGTGDVSAQAGTLSEDTDQVLAIGGSLTLADDATYAATIEDAAQASVSVAGDLTLDGDLTVTLPEGLSMEPEEVLLASVGGEIAGEFDSVSVTGSESEWNVQVRDGELWLTTAVDTPDDPGTGVDPSPTDIDCAVVLEQIWNFLDDLWRFFSRLFLP